MNIGRGTVAELAFGQTFPPACWFGLGQALFLGSSLLCHGRGPLGLIPWFFASDLDAVASRAKTLTQWALATSFLNVGSRGKKFQVSFGAQNTPSEHQIIVQDKG